MCRLIPRKAIRINTPCISQIICQWLLNKAGGNPKSASITWSISRLTHCKLCLSTSITIWQLTIWTCKWAISRDRISLAEWVTQEQHLITVAARWSTSVEAKCTLCRCINQTSLEAHLPNIKPWIMGNSKGWWTWTTHKPSISTTN